MTGRSKRESAPKISRASAHESPGMLLRDAHRRLRAGLVEALRQAGHPLTIDAWGVLSQLWYEDNLPQFEIGTRIGRDRHQTSRLIDSLAQLQLVARRTLAEDRRVKRVGLTRKGRAAQQTLGRIANGYLNRAFAGVTQRDYDGFIRCLQHLAELPAPADGEEEPS